MGDRFQLTLRAVKLDLLSNLINPIFFGQAQSGLLVRIRSRPFYIDLLSTYEQSPYHVTPNA